MKIVRMTQSKHIADRYYAELEDGRTVKVNVNMIADHGLFTGRDLTEDELSELESDASKTQSRARALRIIGTRSMSRKEFTDKMTEKGESADAAEENAEWLEKLGYLNDEEYAGMVVRHYAAKGYGAGRIRDELYKRGIDRELAAEAMDQLPEQDGTLDRLCASSFRGQIPDEKTVKKFTDKMRRRGFSWNDISAALERSEPTEGEENDV